MVLDKLSSSLRSSLQKIKNSMFVDKKLINEIVKDIQKALLKSDVDVKLVLKTTKKIKERALNEDKPKTVSKKDYLITVVYEELVDILGGEESFNLENKIKKSNKTYKIMLVGLFGSGKTTTTGKLANYYKKRGIKTAVVSTDTWRPAAAKQLQQLSKEIGVDCYINPNKKNPEKIYQEFEKEYDEYDLLIIDTAGRDALNDELITELKDLDTAVQANDIFLVLSADIGQAAEKQAQAFHDTTGVTGVIITKLDGTAKGGGALIACSITDAPIRFLGVGEKTNDLERFNPKSFVGRILGLGDLEGLLEKTRAAFDEEEAKDLSKKMLKGEFNLLDMYDQMDAMQNMGSLSKIMDMIPGFNKNKIPKEMLEGQEEKMKDWKHLMNSMTKEELEDPTIMRKQRVERVSHGAGMDTKELRQLLKHYKQSKKMMKMMKGGKEQDMEKMMKKMQRKGLR